MEESCSSHVSTTESSLTEMNATVTKLLGDLRGLMSQDVETAKTESCSLIGQIQTTLSTFSNHHLTMTSGLVSGVAENVKKVKANCEEIQNLATSSQEVVRGIVANQKSVYEQLANQEAEINDHLRAKTDEKDKLIETAKQEMSDVMKNFEMKM